MIKNWYRIFLIAILAVAFVGCDELLGSASVDENELNDIFSTEAENDSTANRDDQMEVMGVEFTPGYRHFKILVSVNNIGPYAFTDTTQVVVKATEYIGGVPNNSSSKPVLTYVRNTEGEQITKERVKMLVLVDLDQPQTVVDEELSAVREIRTVIGANLYLAFMSDMSVSETMQATDYVLNSRFVSNQSQHKYLYRSIMLKKKEIEDHAGPWVNARKVVMAVFSDERVYGDNDEPIDPDHFALQEALIKPDSLLSSNFLSISAVRFGGQENAPSDDPAVNVMKVLSKNYGGIYEEKFSWADLKENVMGMKVENIIANEFDFENPDGKVYSGVSHVMVIELFDKEDGHLLGKASTAIFFCFSYNPVIVNGYTNIAMFFQGIGLVMLVILLVYLIFQFLIPYIHYELFKKKYVVKYIPGNMSVGNIAVSESCYYCKAPFNPGDDVVVKCEHVMHKSCWDENGYHCPEYGWHCQNGSHYYNHQNLFDHKNALYHLKWIVMAIAAALVAWFLYVVLVLEYDNDVPTLVARMTTSQLPEVDSFAVFNGHADNRGYEPMFGLCLGFCLTIVFSFLAAGRRLYPKRFLDFFLRGLVVGLLAYFVFMVTESLIIAFNVNTMLIFFDWIPWSVMALLIAFASTFESKYHLRKYLLLIGIILGVISVYAWTVFFRGVLQMDIRVLMLFSCMFYSVGVGLAIAQLAPISDHYFLNVKGAVKETDIALYKWFINNPDEVVTIGKSIDCLLQMTWDVKGQVAPVHANLRQTVRGISLTALEDGVMIDGKPLYPGHSRSLFHNMKFSIGDTTFTYIERDI